MRGDEWRKREGVQTRRITAVFCANGRRSKVSPDNDPRTRREEETPLKQQKSIFTVYVDVFDHLSRLSQCRVLSYGPHAGHQLVGGYLPVAVLVEEFERRADFYFRSTHTHTQSQRKTTFIFVRVHTKGPLVGNEFVWTMTFCCRRPPVQCNRFVLADAERQIVY